MFWEGEESDGSELNRDFADLIILYTAALNTLFAIYL